LAKEFLKAGDNVLVCSRSGVDKFLDFQYVSTMLFVYFTHAIYFNISSSCMYAIDSSMIDFSINLSLSSFG